MVEDAAHFLVDEDGGQAFGLRGVQGGNRASAPFQRLAGEEQKSAEGLISSGGGDSRFACQMGEECFDVGRPHLVRVAFAMEQDKAPDSVHGGGFGADGVVVTAQGIADLVEQVLGNWFHWCSSDGIDTLRFLSYHLSELGVSKLPANTRFHLTPLRCASRHW